MVELPEGRDLNDLHRAGETTEAIHAYWDAAKYLAPKSLRRAGDFRDEIVKCFYPSAGANQGQGGGSRCRLTLVGEGEDRE